MTDTIVKETVRGRVILAPSRVKNEGQFWNTYQISVPHGHTLEDALSPAYWASVAAARQLRPFDVFELRAEDNSFGADLMVLEAGRSFARVKLLRTIDIEGETDVVEAPLGLTVAYKGPVLKHIVIRDSDKAILREGFSRKVEAETWAKDYARTIG